MHVTSFLFFLSSTLPVHQPVTQGPLLSEYNSITSTPLVLNLGRLAARGIDTATWQSEAVSVQELISWPIGDWRLAEFATGGLGATEAGLRERVGRLASKSPGGFVSPVFVGLDGGPVFVTPTLLVAFEVDYRGATARATIADFGRLSILAEDWAGMPGSYKLSVDSANGFDILDLAADLARRVGVRYAEPDWIFTGHGGHVPNDPQFGQQWGLHNIGQTGGVPNQNMNTPQAWDITQGDSAIKVMIIDNGIQQNHPDIHQIPGFDLTSDGPGPGGPVNSFDKHGTPVAGCVSATIDNGLGVAGIAPQCVSVSARTFISIDANGSWTSQASWTVNALQRAVDIGVRVTNNSNGYGFTSSAIKAKYQSTRNAGMMHFAAAGNDSFSSLGYPARLPSVAAVAAIQSNGNLAGFSNFGQGLAFAAPGEGIQTTDRTAGAGYVGGDYVLVNGTSFASPYVAGVAALLFSRNSSLSANEVEEVLQASAKDLGASGYDTTYGWGLPDAWAALLLVDPPHVAFCFGDGTGTVCPCFDFGNSGQGCGNSTGIGAVLSAFGEAHVSGDHLVLTIEGSVPSAPGLLFQGSAVQAGGSGVMAGNGLLCFTSQKRWSVRFTDILGSTSYGSNLLGSDPAAVPGATLLYQWWYRDVADSCGSGFNFSNGVAVTWQ